MTGTSKVKGSDKSEIRVRIIAGLLMCALIGVMLINETIWRVFAAGIGLISWVEIWRVVLKDLHQPQTFEARMERLQKSLLYLGFVIGGMYCLSELRTLSNGVWLVLLVLGPAASNDTMALFVGKGAGSHARKLPGVLGKVSPNKSIEGLRAGVLAGYISYIVILLVAVGVVGSDIPVLPAVIYGLIQPWLAVAGDLTESSVKRSYNIKCFANYIPGHECITDRIDSWVPTSIAALALFRLFG